VIRRVRPTTPDPKCDEEHRAHGGGAHELLRAETEGCAVHITIGLHDQDGRPPTSIEIELSRRADNSDVWYLRGSPTTWSTASRKSLAGELPGRPFSYQSRAP
jgi:hypothetical protein